MSKVRLYGDTSGYVDLKAPDVANDVTITLPNESGPFATETYVDNAIDTSGGVIIAVKHALFTGTQTNSTASGANFAVTDLSITHTLADASNKLIISAYFGVAGSSLGRGTVGIAVADDGTLVGVGASPGSRVAVGAGGNQLPFPNDGSGDMITMPSVMFVYEPGDVAAHTYTVRAINTNDSTRTININRSQTDTDSALFTRGSSGFVIQEVKV